MIIYIHGFGSSGKAKKAVAFEEYFKSVDEPYMAPSLPYIPDLAIKNLEDIIECFEDVCLIGSSLGGFYATYLSNMKNVKKVVLINPAVNKNDTLQKYIGDATCFYDNSTFSWTKNHIKMLDKYKTTNINRDKFMVLLQKGDEVLDYKEAVKKYNGTKMIVEDGGNHSFDGIQRHFDSCYEFYKKSIK